MASECEMIAQDYPQKCKTSDSVNSWERTSRGKRGGWQPCVCLTVMSSIDLLILRLWFLMHYQLTMLVCSLPQQELSKFRCLHHQDEDIGMLTKEFLVATQLRYVELIISNLNSSDPPVLTNGLTNTSTNYC